MGSLETTAEITREAPCKTAALRLIRGVSSADEPDKGNPGAGGGKSGETQRLWQNGESTGGCTLHSLGKQRVEGALDYQNQSERGPQIPHHPGGDGEQSIVAPRLPTLFIVNPRSRPVIRA